MGASSLIRVRIESCPLHLLGLSGLPLAKSCSERLCNASAEAFGDDSIPKPIDRKKRWLQKVKDFKSGACRRILPTSTRVRCLHSRADAVGLL